MRGDLWEETEGSNNKRVTSDNRTHGISLKFHADRCRRGRETLNLLGRSTYVRAGVSAYLGVNHSQGHPGLPPLLHSVLLLLLTQVKEALRGRVEEEEGGGKRAEARTTNRSRGYTVVCPSWCAHLLSTNGRSVTSSTLKTHFNHDRRKDRRDRDPSIARPGRVYGVRWRRYLMLIDAYTCRATCPDV